MDSLKSQILKYVKNKYPQEVSGVEIEDFARFKGFSAENGRRRLRELTGSNKLIEAIHKTIVRPDNRRLRITNYRYQGVKLPPPFKEKPQQTEIKQPSLL
jgi:hypothetical protein